LGHYRLLDIWNPEMYGSAIRKAVLGSRLIERLSSVTLRQGLASFWMEMSIKRKGCKQARITQATALIGDERSFALELLPVATNLQYL